MASGWYPGFKHHIDRFKVYNFMSKGEQLYKIGLYDRALKYFDSAQRIDPTLAFEVATHKHRIASDLLTIADSLNDLNSLKFVVFALEETQRLTGSLSPSNIRILDQLKQKLKAKEEYDIRQKIDLKLLQEKKSKSEIRSIIVGMTISEVENIMGKPSEIVSSGQQNENQLWIYNYENGDEISLIFTNYKLFRIKK